MTAANYEVTETTVAPRLIAGVRVRVPRGRVAQYFGPALDQVYAAGRSGAIALDGQNIFIYGPGPDGDLIADFCVGAKAPFDAIGNVQPMQTPAGLAATTTHWGDYGRLGEANRAVHEWCQAHGRVLAGPSWEVYGHWNEDPVKLRTDVYYLLAPAQSGA